MPLAEPGIRQRYYLGIQWVGYFDGSVFGTINDDTNTGGTGIPQRATIDIGNQVEHLRLNAETHNA